MPDPRPGYRNGMRATPMKRTPFKPKPTRAQRRPSQQHDRMRAEVLRLDVNLLPKKKPVRKVKQAGVLTIAGMAWPEHYMPEEPETGFLRHRDVCFRWQVEDLFFDNGWKYLHLSEAKKSDPGFPDLVGFRERQLWAELKVRDRLGRLNGMTPEQIAFANMVIRAGGEFHCWTWPDDWDELVGLVA